MKKLAASIFALLISLSFHADARLVSGTAQHQHDSATGGGATINNTSIGSNSKIAPSIYVYDSAAPANEKYWKFGNANGDFGLFTYDDTPSVASTVFSITRTGTTPNSLDLGSVSLKSSKPCAAGYTRLTPNYCINNDNASGVGLTRDVCTQITAPSATARAVRLRVVPRANSANAIGLRETAAAVYLTNTCAAQISDTVRASAFEHTAQAAVILAEVSSSVTLLLSSVGGDVWIKFVDDASNLGVCYYILAGYYD